MKTIIKTNSMRKIILILSLVSLSFVLNAQEIIKVACIGNSITYGSGIKDRENKSYPAVLGKILGNKYEVINFGVGGRTLLSKGDYPYVKEKQYTESLKFQPDIVIIKLGTNDSKPQNWKYKRKYMSDYIKLIKSYQKLKSKPVIYLCKAVPAFKLQWGINPDIIKNEINPAIEIIAEKTKSKIIDLYTPFLNDGADFPDNIHPDAKGAEKMAKIICGEILSRQKSNFDFGWKFSLEDSPGAFERNYDDSKWKQIDVPHDWSITAPFLKDNPSGRSGGFASGGIGWYRKNFNLNGIDSSSQVSIEFDGIYMNSEVWINGNYLGKRPFGYISFNYDMTPYLNFDGENVLAVRVDNSKMRSSRWYTGCGIYRHVWLISTNKLHISRHGVYATTKSITTDSAIIEVRTTIENNYVDNKQLKFIIRTVFV